MPKDESRKNNSLAIAIIGLIGTAITAIFGSPVLVEWIRSRQVTATPPAIVTQIPAENTEVPIIVTPQNNFTEQVLIFREDFDNDNVSGFAYEGNWQVVKDKNNRVLEATGPGTATFGPSDFTHGVIEFRVQIQESSGDSMAAVSFRNNGNTSYTLTFAENQLVLGQREGSNFVQPFSNETTRSLVFEKGAWYLIRVEVRGPDMIVFVDNNRIMSASNGNLSKGGLNFSVGTGMQVAFDDVNVWELK
jgi:hypothetical protein